MSGTSFERLRAFFEGAEVVRRATRPLRREAEVGLDLAAGPARFSMEGGRAAVHPGAAADPDFTLWLPDAAVERLTVSPAGDAGELGIEFFRLVLERDPALKVRIRLHASTARLVSRGYLGVLALGGLKVAIWLLRKGVANPRGAIERFRGR